MVRLLQLGVFSTLFVALVMWLVFGDVAGVAVIVVELVWLGGFGLVLRRSAGRHVSGHRPPPPWLSQ